MKNTITVLSIISLGFILAFFSIQTVVIKNNTIISGKLQIVFGVVFLLVSVCIFIFLIIALLRKINLPVFIEVNLFEIFIAAVVIGVASLLMIFRS